MNFSIVTPVYNDPRLRQTLESILVQSGVGNVEIIVIDGNSSDCTTDVLDKYSDRIDFLVSEPDKGVYDAMNKGIQRATGDIIGILNANDRYHDNNVLQDVQDAIQEMNADIAYGDLVYIDGNDGVVRYWNSGEFRPYKFYLGWMPPHPTFFARKYVYDKFKHYNLSYLISADYELMLRYLMKHRLTTAYVDRVLVEMSVGGLSNESLIKILRANYEVWRAWRNNSIRGGFSAPVLKPLRKCLQYHQKPK